MGWISPPRLRIAASPPQVLTIRKNAIKKMHLANSVRASGRLSGGSTGSPPVGMSGSPHVTFTFSNGSSPGLSPLSSPAPMRVSSSLSAPTPMTPRHSVTSFAFEADSSSMPPPAFYVRKGM